MGGRRSRAGRVDDRDAGPDRQPSGCAWPLHQRAIWCVSRQLLSDQKLTMRPTISTLTLVLVGLACFGAVHLRASDPGTGNWPMWGGTPDRNQVSNMKNVPT